MKSSKMVALVVAVIVIIAAIVIIYCLQKNTTAVPTGLNNWQKHTEGDFSLQYPDTYVYVDGMLSSYRVDSGIVTTGGQEGSVLTDGLIKLDPSNYQDTNLVAAMVAFSHSSDVSELECQKTYSGVDVVELSKASMINDVTWYELENGWVGSVAAGTNYESRIYHAYVDSVCYEVKLHLATTNIGNFDFGSTTAVDEGAIRAQLQSIFHTAQFAQ